MKVRYAEIPFLLAVQQVISPSLKFKSIKANHLA